jgi:peptidoglycan/LPS O-acetylase OafA/YrhL
MRIKDYSETNYVTGMRAFAALWVLLIHTGGGGLKSLGPWGDGFVDLGRGGVYAFFVISGFSVASSWKQAGGYRHYLFMRFMRLAPLYYVWLLIYALVMRRGGQWALLLGVPSWPVDILLHLAFLNAFYLQAANSFIGLEWSLSVEMFWYLLLPGLLWLAGWCRGLVLIGLGLASYFLIQVLFARRAELDGAVRLALYWHPFVYFLCYALGVWSFTLRATVPQGDRAGGVLLALGILAAYAGVPWWQASLQVDMVLVVSLVTFLLLVYGSKENFFCRHLFLSRPALVLGTLSYGIYLSHLFVLQCVKDFFSFGTSGRILETLSVLSLSVLAAWAGFVLIEQPCQRWAKGFRPPVNKSISLAEVERSNSQGNA